MQRHHPMGTVDVVAAGPCLSLVWDKRVRETGRRETGVGRGT